MHRHRNASPSARAAGSARRLAGSAVTRTTTLALAGVLLCGGVGQVHADRQIAREQAAAADAAFRAELHETTQRARAAHADSARLKAAAVRYAAVRRTEALAAARAAVQTAEAVVVATTAEVPAETLSPLEGATAQLVALIGTTPSTPVLETVPLHPVTPATRAVRPGHGALRSDAPMRRPGTRGAGGPGAPTAPATDAATTPDLSGGSVPGSAPEARDAVPSDAVPSDAAPSDTVPSDAVTPDAVLSDTVSLDAVTPDAVTPDAVTPDSRTADSRTADGQISGDVTPGRAMAQTSPTAAVVPDAAVATATPATGSPVDRTDPAVTTVSSPAAPDLLPVLDLSVSAEVVAAAQRVTELSIEVQAAAEAAAAAAAAAQAAAEEAARAEAAELARKIAVAKEAPNGEIPAEALCSVEIAPQALLRCDAARALDELAAAYRADVGHDLDVVSTYRSYASQVAVKAQKGGLAATPGRSNHGRGLAVDLGGFGGVGEFTAPAYRWMKQHAETFGWHHPAAMEAGGSGPQEPWHWEFDTED